MKYILNLQGVDTELYSGMDEVLPLWNITRDPKGIPVTVRREGQGITVEEQSDGIHIRYGTKVEFFRALSMLPEVLSGHGAVNEKPSFDTLCFMADMSRNAVLNVFSAKRLMRYLAVMGYDSLMLYTEDTYEIPEYPYFGHMRGRFTQQELKELDAYAADLGIELIPCIQTLAHLNAALRWNCFHNITDVQDILLAEDERTYALISCMIRSVASCFTSRKINLGMDEAFLLGLGKYLRQHGYTDGSSIMLKHLRRVLGICEEYGFRPMMWSDMFFRLAYGEYYVTQGEISEEVKKQVPPNLTLIYWDYYTTSSERFADMVDRHLRFDNSIAFAGGAWKWQGFAPDNAFSMRVSRMQLEVCRQKVIRDVMVTTWGDNGAEASVFSVLPTLLLFAEQQFAPDAGDDWLERRFESCFGLPLATFMKLDLPDRLPGMPGMSGLTGTPERTKNPSKYLLYNDPLNGLFDRHVDVGTFPMTYHAHADNLRAASGHPDFGYIFETLAALCALLEKKSVLSVQISAAYTSQDKTELNRIAREDILEIIQRLEAFINLFRRQWYRENKTFGFDVQEIRLGGLKERLYSTQLRLAQYLAGEVDCIEELEQPSLYFDCRAENDSEKSLHLRCNNWAQMATANTI